MVDTTPYLTANLPSVILTVIDRVVRITNVDKSVIETVFVMIV